MMVCDGVCLEKCAPPTVSARVAPEGVASHTLATPLPPLLKMLAAVVLGLGYTLTAPKAQVGAVARSVPVRCDADRCYYGRVDEDGNVLKGSAEVETGPSVKPSVKLTASEVVAYL